MTSASIVEIRNSLCGLSVALLLLVGANARAQRRVSADVEVKQVTAGKVFTVTKSVYCANNGRLVIHFISPDEFYVVTNPLGEARMFSPRTNTTESDPDNSYSTKDELLYFFLTGRLDDLGVTQDGYKLISTTNEDGLMKRVFKSATDGNKPQIEIVYKNYLPIYLAYLDNTGTPVNKTYFSNYSRVQRLMVPCRVTNIAYITDKDSTVVRTIYSNVKVDTDDPMFDFNIPSASKR